MIPTRRSVLLLAALASTAGAASLPADFESAGDELAPLFAYFGGVGGLSTSISAEPVYAGNSLAVAVQWQPDLIFDIAGAVIGDRLITGADLNVPASPSVVSFAVLAPTDHTYSIQIVLGEDDNGDGDVDPLGGDDEWVSPRVFLEPGLAIYNIDLAQLTDESEDGNGVQNFSTTGAMSVEVIIETRADYPGGMAQAPATFYLDHVGLYESPQTLDPTNPADFNADGVVDAADLAALIAAWGGAGAADLNNDGVVDAADLAALIAAWG